MSLDMEDYADEVREKAELARKFGDAILNAKTDEERAKIIQDSQAKPNTSDYIDLACNK
jgi:hypothetical protein|tara:strand:- start:171059 stop:171235 length:177 start_codon:yes stop_codon:yes gene_type:complete